MDQTRLVLIAAVAVAVAAVAVLLLAVGRRWFARFHHGFLLSVVVALAGTGLAIAGVLGLWAYAENRDTLVRQLVTGLTHIADIQQNEIREDLRDAQTQLQFFATRLGDEARRNPAAVSARYDMQDDLAAFVKVARFGATGYTAVTNGEGRLIAHPDEKRLNEDVTRYPVVRAALDGRTTHAVTVNAAGDERLMVGRPFDSPATLHPKPWVLVSETATAEAFGPIRPLRVKFAVAA